MQSLLYRFIIVSGVLQAMGNAMNAQLDKFLVNPCSAASVSFLPVAFLLITLLLVMPRPLPTVQDLARMPWWAPLGGLAGAVAVLAGLFFTQKIGAGPAASPTFPLTSSERQSAVPCQGWPGTDRPLSTPRSWADAPRLRHCRLARPSA